MRTGAEDAARPRPAAWLAIASLALAACDCGTAPPPPEREGDRELVAGIAERVLLPTYRDFATESATLVAATSAHAAAPSAETRAAAQEAWRRAMSVWQRVEVMQVGPLAPSSQAVGGTGLRDEIYAWPSLRTCVVDQRTVADVHDDPDALADNPVDERGLGAIEYLLFVETTDNSCPAVSGINTDGSWAALTPEEIEQRRASQAWALATIVHRHAEALRTEWEADGGDFVGQLGRAGQEGSPYEHVRKGLEAITDAMFYVDLMLKDRKLAIPAGLSTDCPEETCPERVESRWAGRSKEHVLENLRAFELLFLGGPPDEEARGFDDLLVELGEGALAEEILDAIALARAAVSAIPGTLREALTTDLAAVRAAYDAVKQLTDALKMRFYAAVMLALPGPGGGDTD